MVIVGIASGGASSLSPMMKTDDVPRSVEEAGALLGAAITRCGVTSHTTVLPPKGMHSSFATVSPVPSSELFTRLHSLRALLRSSSSTVPLVAAPSLLAVLMKLLGVSNSLASSAPSLDATTPPMLSTPLRQLWVDCVVLCHSLGEGLSGAARIDVFAFIRNMITLAGMNPKSAKATGGTRIAALQVIGGLFCNAKLESKLAPWALDVLQLCHRSLRSSGNGEPTFRITSVQTACCVAIACRQASLASRRLEGRFIIHGAMEDRAISETTRLLRLATTDKFPEVRDAAANLGSLVAPMLLHSGSPMSKSSDGSGASSLTSSLEEVLVLSMRNLDDEIAGVAVSWADAMARCLCACIAYGQQLRSNTEGSSRRNAEDGDDASGVSSDHLGRMRKGTTLVQQCSTLPSALSYVVDHFIKVGGELAASRLGGHFSIGGRAVRIGLSLTMVKLLGIQSKLGHVGQSRDLSTEDAIFSILQMVGPDMEKQLKVRESGTDIALDATSASVHSPEKSSGKMFGVGRNKSHADAGLARIAASRVLRQGLSEMAPESTQLTILHELITMCIFSELDEGDEYAAKILTSHQLQVVLIEITHLLMTLGEAAASTSTDLIPMLQVCLGHPEHGVRHEAAIACAAVAGPFPTKARKLFRSALDEIQVHHAEIVKLASMDGDLPFEHDDDRSSPKRRFQRHGTKAAHPSLVHQYAVHGHSLMVSILLRELPHLPGGLPGSLLSAGLSVAEILVNCQCSDVLTKVNPGAACTCVRAGYGIICGALTVGPIAITPHTGLIFGLWRKVGESSGASLKNFTIDQDLICLDSALSSVVAFLTHCSELLLLAPDALSSSTLMLEKLLPLFLPDGRFGSMPTNHVAASRYESAKASLMEAFAWLPPGSFPMIADQVFAFAAGHIRSGIEAEVTCSLLPSLVNNEDEVLDAKSLPRAQRLRQVGGARDIEENLICLLSEVAHPGERESVLHFQKRNKTNSRQEFRGSQVLSLFACDDDEAPLPTPLHAVGTWHEPVSPSSCSKVRLMDAAVQSFSATFGLKDGKEQHNAMLMLESLVPPLLVQLARAIGVDTALVEPERRNKTKDDHAAIANITAVLLACLDALPLHEATHNIPIGLGPPWMNKAKDLLLALLPSTSNIVRRAAAEGLALLATLGVTEDAHTLQSTVLHSLDEVMQGNQPDGKPRIPVAPVSAARAGSLLTLACIQRTTHRITEKHRVRARGRSTNTSAVTEVQNDSLPTIQMMTRIIPSLACHGILRDKEAFVVRTYAMHSFGLIIAYSSRLDHGKLSIESLHLLKKAVEVVEGNFLAAWTSVSSQFDGGQEADKLAAEASFLAVLLRLMTFLVPTLPILASSEPTIGERFAAMAHVMLDLFGAHPVVFMEGMAFFEQLSLHQSLLPPPSIFLRPSEDYLTSCLPSLLEGLTPEQPSPLAEASWLRCRGVRSSTRGETVAVRVAKLLSLNQVLIPGRYEGDIAAVLFSLLEVTCGRRIFAGETLYRPLASCRQADISNSDHVVLEIEITQTLDTIVRLEETFDAASDGAALLHWILFARCLLTGSIEKPDDKENEGDPYTRGRVRAVAKGRASESALHVFEFAAPVRWQTRCQAARSATLALQSISRVSQSKKNEESPHFDSAIANAAFAQQCKDQRAFQSDPSESFTSFVVFHAGEILSSACSSAVATMDQSELWHVQEGGIRLLTEVVSCIGDTEDLDEPGEILLEQYLSQVLSCVKHALTAYQDDDEDDAETLFILGCEVLQTVVQNRLITDPMVLKRLVRPVLLSQSDVTFFGYEETPDRNWLPTDEDSSFKNFRLSILPIIGKLWTLGKLRGYAEEGIMAESVVTALLDEMDACNGAVASYSAAVAIDGARLLRGSGMSLCGMIAEEVSDGDEPTQDFGFMFDDMHDVDNLVKPVLVQAWPACACDAMFSLIDVMQTGDVDESTLAACSTWLEKLTPIVFAGLRDSFSAISCRENDRPKQVDFAKGLSTEEVTASCLRGLCALLQGASCNQELVNSSTSDLAFVVSNISHLVLFPVSGVNTRLDMSSSENEETKEASLVAIMSLELVTEACKFIEVLAASEAMSDGVESAFLLAVLTPLDALQKGDILFDSPLVVNIVSSSLKAVQQFIKQAESGKDALVNAMLQLSIDIVSGSTAPAPVIAAAELLLTECLDNDAIPISLHRELARQMATDGKYEVWALIGSHSSDGTALSHSLPELKTAMSEVSLVKRHLPALSAIRSVINELNVPSDLIDIIMRCVGAQVLGLLKAYGTLSIPDKGAEDHRLNACTDCMKVIMTAYQNLMANSAVESQMAAFLSVVLDVWTSVIAYNGLPNQASPQPGADPTLGRLSAQAIVHVARLSPVAFKTSMTTLSDQGRALLEFAVRADMSGYATTTTQAPVKKKLSLQGFTK